MNLIIATIEDFKKIIYPEYIKLFPEKARKTYNDINKSVFNNISKIIKIVVDNEVVGFMIINSLKDNYIIHLDYLGIFSNYQNNGYGGQAIKLLKEKYKEYKGIFIEVEKDGLGANDEENIIRSRRIQFYERLGFYKMKFELEIDKITYSSYILPCIEIEFVEEKVIKNILEIYSKIFSKSKVQKNIKVIIQ